MIIKLTTLACFFDRTVSINIFEGEVERAINSTGRLTEETGIPATAYYISNGAYLEAGIGIEF